MSDPTSPTESCPTTEALRALANGAADPADADACVRHLDTCERCRATLAAIVDEDRVTRSLREAASATDSALLRALVDRLKVEGQAVHAGSDLAERDVLDRLEPSEDERSIGRFDRYEVLDLIGRGAMGVVLKALDVGLDRIVALKVLAPQLAATPNARRRFVREAQAAAAVSHPHVVTIHAVGEWSGLPYLVMECVGGVSLQERIDESGPLDPREVLRVGLQAASGLAAAHAQGIVHRDIKPSNILLENGVARVKITDFGLARAIDDASITETGVLAGTPQYMAPEQARGESVDHRADLFSLGSLLFTAATGQPPFRGSTALSVVRRVADQRPPRVDEVTPEAPKVLADLIGWLHEPDPADRPQSADALARELSRTLASLQAPGASRGAPARATVTPATSRRPRALKLAAAALALVVTFLSVSEATGTTRIVETVATVLRIHTPAGTLVLEIDDPSLDVVVDRGGEEVVLSGQEGERPEVRLRPGRHELQVRRDGRPLSTQWVTVSQGGRQIVRVGIEPEGAEGVGAPGTAPTREEGAARPLEASPPTFLVWRQLESGQTAEAEKGFRRILAARPDDAQAHNGLGFCLLSTGRVLEAEASFERALELEPAHPGILNGLARVRLAQGRHEEAIELWKRADPGTGPANAATLGLGETLSSLGRYSEAIPYLERLVRGALLGGGSPQHRVLLDEARRHVAEEEARDRGLAGPRFRLVYRPAPEHGGEAAVELAAKAAEALEQRFASVDVFGVVVRAEGGRVVVEGPLSPQTPASQVAEDLEKLKMLAKRAGRLSFRVVADDSPDTEELERLVRGEARAAVGSEVMPTRVVRLSRVGEVGGPRWVLENAPGLAIVDVHVESATATLDATGAHAISFRLAPASAAALSELSDRNVGRRVAILLDGEIVQAPTIRSKIGANVQITGRFSLQESRELAWFLGAPKLPGKLELVSESIFGETAPTPPDDAAAVPSERSVPSANSAASGHDDEPVPPGAPAPADASVPPESPAPSRSPEAPESSAPPARGANSAG